MKPGPGFRDHLIGLMAEAMEKSVADGARQQVQDFSMSVGEFKDLVRTLRSENPRSVAIVSFAAIEELIERFLSFRMRHVSSKERAKLLGPFGPLGNSANRILLLSSLGWISVRTKESLDCMRSLRNSFAHCVHLEDTVYDKIRHVFYAANSQWSVGLKAVSQLGYCPLDKIDDNSVMICHFLYSFLDLLQDVTFLPIAIDYQVSPQSISGHDFEHFPKLHELSRIVIRNVLEVMAGEVSAEA